MLHTALYQQLRLVVVWGILYWSILGPLIPAQELIQATAYMNVAADRVLPFTTTSSHVCLEQDNTLCQKAQIISI